MKSTISTTEEPLLNLVLDSQAQAALLRSQNALLAWQIASNDESGKLWDERVAAALQLADLVSRLETVKRISDEMMQGD